MTIQRVHDARGNAFRSLRCPQEILGLRQLLALAGRIDVLRDVGTRFGRRAADRRREVALLSSAEHVFGWAGGCRLAVDLADEGSG